VNHILIPNENHMLASWASPNNNHGVMLSICVFFTRSLGINHVYCCAYVQSCEPQCGRDGERPKRLACLAQAGSTWFSILWPMLVATVALKTR
jgi:hypothetical protein